MRFGVGSDATRAQCIDAMGYHDGGEIPNYRAYAKNYVLQDHMYEPNASWSLPEHLFQVSEWSAFCTDPLNPASCANALQNLNPSDGQSHYAWTDITYLLHQQNVSWGYYVFKGTEPDCESDQSMTCAPVQQGPQTPGIWNPLPEFGDVRQDDQTGNVVSSNQVFTDAKAGTLPAVSWVVPSGDDSEHPPANLASGQRHVTNVINAIVFLSLVTVGALVGRPGAANLWWRPATTVGIAVAFYFALIGPIFLYIAIRPSGGTWRDIARV